MLQRTVKIIFESGKTIRLPEHVIIKAIHEAGLSKLLEQQITGKLKLYEEGESK